MNVKNKTYLSLPVFIASATLMVIFAIYPLSKDIGENSREFISQKQNLANLGEKIKGLGEFKILYKGYGPNLEMIDNLFINFDLPVDFITFLENTAKDCQLEIGISPNSSKNKDEFWYYLGFSVNVTGSPANFMKFLDKIENAPYFIKIQNLTASRSKEGSEGIVNANISFNVYVK
jgi:hypothetical protein